MFDAEQNVVRYCLGYCNPGLEFSLCTNPFVNFGSVTRTAANENMAECAVPCEPVSATCPLLAPVFCIFSGTKIYAHGR
jgi:hypothetical protein